MTHVMWATVMGLVLQVRFSCTVGRSCDCHVISCDCHVTHVMWATVMGLVLQVRFSCTVGRSCDCHVMSSATS